MCNDSLCVKIPGDISCTCLVCSHALVSVFKSLEKAFCFCKNEGWHAVALSVDLLIVNVKPFQTAGTLCFIYMDKPLSSDGCLPSSMVRCSFFVKLSKSSPRPHHISSLVYIWHYPPLQIAENTSWPNQGSLPALITPLMLSVSSLLLIY